jgi:hypothetical protein
MSGETVFDGEDLETIEGTLKEPMYRTGFDRNYWIWETPQPTSTYLVCADVARGDGKDYSVFHVLKLETMEFVAEYQGKVTPDIFSRILHDASREYNNALLVVENNSVGFAVLEKLIESNYENLYYSIKSTHEYVDKYTAETSSNSIAGFSTTSKTRPLIIAKMEEFVRNNLINIYSSRLYNEMKTFIWNNGKPEAMRNYNDDLIMACAVGCWVRDTALVVNKRDLEYKKAFLSSMMTSNTSLDSRIPGQIKSKNNRLQERKMEHRKVSEQFPWLLKG